MSEEAIRIRCPSLTCKKILAVPSSSRGKTVKCKNCGGMIRVPLKCAAPKPAPDAEQADDGQQSEAA